jgi:hypothetical protein
MMSQDRLEMLKNVIAKSDNSPAGVAARQMAKSEIEKWNNQLYEFIKKNPGTDVAKTCGHTILQLSDFCTRY